jgi:hypothetical protein
LVWHSSRTDSSHPGNCWATVCGLAPAMVLQAFEGLSDREACDRLEVELRNSTGGFTKEDFNIDLRANTVACPAGHTVPVRFGRA